MGKFIDLTGRRFERLVVIERAEDYVQPSNSKSKIVQWLCKCDCGNTTIVRGSALRDGTTKSCSCLQRETALKSRFKDLTGQRFGRLLVIGREKNHIKPSGGSVTQWKCLCECGNIVIVRSSSLISGHTKSCGCIVSPQENRDLIDRKIGRLIVIREVERKICGGKERRYYLCQCSCGNTTEVTRDALLQGNTQSCGCLYQEVNRQRGANSHAWKDGLTPLQTLIRHSEKYVEWRDSVLRRDKYVCTLSGVKNCRDLEVHHIKSFVQILRGNNITTLEEAFACQELWDVSNGVTMSEEYHSGIKTDNPKSFHRLYGVTKHTPQDFKEWFLAIAPEFAEELRGA